MSAENQIKIAVDVMGGDHAPAIPVEAAAEASLKTNANFLLVGDEQKIKNILDSHRHDPKKIEVLHTFEYIGDDEYPRNIIRQKKDASMNIATDICGRGEAHAVISAGNTGAYILSSIKHIPRLETVNKVAIASLFPTKKFLTGAKKHYSLILDVGANNQCNEEDLLRFAIMGKSYFNILTGEENPKIYLLNVGDEAHKGGKILVNAYQKLSDCKTLNFLGNIEGNKIFNGVADVIVCDGFAGNIFLKNTEGIIESLMDLGKFAARRNFFWKIGLYLLNSGIQKIKPLLDYSEYGGAPLLGFQKIVIKAHGRSNKKAFYNALQMALESYRKNLCGKISEEL